MSERVISALMLVVALIHFLPLIGVVDAARVAALYEVQVVTPDLEILLRHRAVFFGLIGCLCTYAAFNAAVQPLAFVAAGVSVVSFLALAYFVGDYNNALARAVFADWVALACLLVAIVIYVLRESALRVISVAG